VAATTVATARARRETGRRLDTRRIGGLVGETGLGRRGGRRGVLRSLCLISRLDTISIAALGENATVELEVSLLGTAGQSRLTASGLETGLLESTLESLDRHTTTTTHKRSSEGERRSHLFHPL
jgi:hypothetical protein